MKCKECKIICEGKEVAIIDCTKDGFNIKCTQEGKKMCEEFGKECCL